MEHPGPHILLFCEVLMSCNERQSLPSFMWPQRRVSWRFYPIRRQRCWPSDQSEAAAWLGFECDALMCCVSPLKWFHEVCVAPKWCRIQLTTLNIEIIFVVWAFELLWNLHVSCQLTIFEIYFFSTAEVFYENVILWSIKFFKMLHAKLCRKYLTLAIAWVFCKYCLCSLIQNRVR